MNDPYVRKRDDACQISPFLLALGGEDAASDDEGFVPGENKQQLFHYKWLQMKSLKRWIEEDTEDDKAAWCKYCSIPMPAKMSILLAHRRKRSHKMLGREYRDTHWAMTNMMDEFRELAKLIEICKDANKSDVHKLLRLCVYTVVKPKMALKGKKKQSGMMGYQGSSEEEDSDREYSIPGIRSDNEEPTPQDDLLYREKNEEDPVIPVELSRDRCVALITKVLAPHCRARIVDDVGDGCFSLYIDNRIDNWFTYFGLIINYTSLEAEEMVTRFLTLVRVEKRLDAEKEAAALKKALSDYGLNFNKLTGIAIDDGNRGEGNKVFKLLQKDLPNLVLIPCLHHSPQTVCSEASLYPMDMTKAEMILYHTNAFFTDGEEWGEAKYNRHYEAYQLLQDEDDPMNEVIYKDTTWSNRLPAVRQVYKNWDKLKTFFKSHCCEDSNNGPEIMKLLAQDDVRAHLAVLEFILSKFEPIHNMLDVQNIDSFRVYEEMENLMTFFHDLIAIKPDDVTMEEEVTDNKDVASGDATSENKTDVKIQKESVDVVMEENDVTAKRDSGDVVMEESDITSKSHSDDVTKKVKTTALKYKEPDLSEWNAEKLFALVDHDIESLNSEQKKELSEVMLKFILEIIEQLKGRIPDMSSIKRVSALFKSEENVVADEMLKDLDEEAKTKIMKQISELKTSQSNVIIINEEFWEALEDDKYKDLLKFCRQISILPHINITSGKILHALKYVRQQYGFGSKADQFEFVNSMLIIRYFMKTEMEDWEDFWIDEELEAKVPADLEIGSMKRFWFDKAAKLMIYTNTLI